jgi:hypothetical protein
MPLKMKTPLRVKPRTLPALVATMARSDVATDPAATARDEGAFAAPFVDAGACAVHPADASAAPATDTPAYPAACFSQSLRSIPDVACDGVEVGDVRIGPRSGRSAMWCAD